MQEISGAKTALSFVRCCASAFSLLALLSGGPSAAQTAADARTEREPFAVIEYFTSSNCLTCREADHALRALAKESSEQGRRVYLLAFHVDYLNNANSKDPLSKLSYSERHFHYAGAFGEGRAQAGEVVINGQDSAPGKARGKIDRALYRALLVPARALITVAAKYAPESKTVNLHYSVKGLEKLRRDFFYFHAALIEDGVHGFVTETASSGPVSGYDNVVRAFESSRFDGRSGEGALALMLPEGVKPEKTRVVFFVQDPENSKILGAGDLPAIVKLK